MGKQPNSVCKKLGRKRWCRIEANGVSGGIWIMWDGDLIDVKVIHVHKQFVHLLIASSAMEE